MRTGSIRQAVLLVVLVVLSMAATLGGPASATEAKPEWKGDKDVMPAAYDWLDSSTPSDTYDVLIVRGKKVPQVLRNLGGVDKDLGLMTPAEAEEYFFDHYVTWPSVVQVQKIGPAVFVYSPYDFRPSERIRKLSTKGVAADFTTTVEWDTYATVARRGKLLRQFDVGFKPPAQGALPEEKGLDFGARKQNVFATGWAYLERLTRIHVTREWFEGDHPTYVLRQPA